MDWAHIIITPLVSALVGAIVAAVVGRIKTAAQDNRAEDAALHEGVLALLRSELTAAYTAHVVRGEPLGLYERENIARVYQAYRDLGGNDIGDRQFAEITNLPISE